MEINAPIADQLSAARPAELGRIMAPKRYPRYLNSLGQFTLFLAMISVSYLLASNFFLQSVRVSGVSMQPTLRNAQLCFLNRWIYHVRNPARGDVVVLRDPVDESLAVKRVIAIGGDVVEFKSGTVFLNGAKLNEPYLKEDTITFPGPKSREQRFVCAPGEFIVLGDNRMNSADSRIYGPVPRSRILGQIR